MSILPNHEQPRAVHLWTERGRLVVQLLDGREIACPLSFFPCLAQAAAKDLGTWELTGQGTGIHWPLLDEDLSVQGLLEGRRSPLPNAKAREVYGPLLLAARKQARLTQKALADRMAKSQTLVSLAERGAIRIGRPYVQETLKACGLPEGWEPET